MDLHDFLSTLPELPRFTVPTPRQCRAWIQATAGGSVFLLSSELTRTQQLWIYNDLKSDAKEVEHWHVYQKSKL